MKRALSVLIAMLGLAVASPATVNCVTVTGPSTLLVPLSTVPLTAVSSGVVTTSSASVKLSSTGVTVIVSVEVSSAPDPSVIVYVATDTDPL